MLTTPARRIAEQFDLEADPELVPRFNIAPTQPVAGVREDDGTRKLAFHRWGLVPGFAKDPRVGARMINARAESVAEHPSFRAAFRRRRCLIPADGFYEWKSIHGQKRPHRVRLEDGALFAFAGLFETWEGPNREQIESCTLLTTQASPILSELHPRMPVILDSRDYALWLDASVTELEPLQRLFEPSDTMAFQIRPVIDRVNNVRNDDPECLQEADPGSEGTPQLSLPGVTR